MQLYNPLFIVPIVTGPLILIIMLVVKRYPPKRINSLYGYRTKQSMSSQEKWDFAQTYSNKLMIRFSMLYTLTAALGIFIHNIDVKVQLIIAIVVLIFYLSIPIIKTEAKLKDM